MKNLLLAIILGAMPLLASATEDVKLGVVDMERLFKNFYKTKIANSKLKKQAETYKRYANKLSESLLKLQQEFKELRDASQNIAFTETQRESKRLAAQDKYRQMQNKKLELEQYNREKGLQMRSQEAKIRKEIILEIRKTIAKYAKENNFTMIIDSSGRTFNDITSVVYFKTELDLTEKILECINKGATK